MAARRKERLLQLLAGLDILLLRNMPKQHVNTVSLQGLNQTDNLRQEETGLERLAVRSDVVVASEPDHSDPSHELGEEVRVRLDDDAAQAVARDVRVSAHLVAGALDQRDLLEHAVGYQHADPLEAHAVLVRAMSRAVPSVAGSVVEAAHSVGFVVVDQVGGDGDDDGILGVAQLGTGLLRMDPVGFHMRMLDVTGVLVVGNVLFGLEDFSHCCCGVEGRT